MKKTLIFFFDSGSHFPKMDKNKCPNPKNGIEN